MARDVEAVLLVPGDLAGPTGGSAYGHRVAREWPGLTVRAVPGAWPAAAPGDRAVLDRELVKGQAPVLLDGLIGCAAPDAVRDAVARGRQVWVLLHLPLPAETGLDPAARERWAAAEAAALRAATGVVCTSEWARDDLLARYGPLPVCVAAPGTDAAPVARGSLPPRLLTLASLTPRKNHLALLDSLARLAAAPWTAHWVGAGTPARRAELEWAVRASRVAGRVRLTGARTGAGLDREWDAADLLVLPSLAETYGMVVAEATARGVPSVVGAGTGAEATLRALAAPGGGLPGTAVDPADSATLAAVLGGWLEDRATRAAWTQAAHAARNAGRWSSWAGTALTLRTVVAGGAR